MSRWFPWDDTLPPTPKSGQNVFVVIPTAGKDIKRLKSCICSIQNASQKSEITVCVVICPTFDEVTKRVKSLQEIDHVIPLDGTFNYCRSINAGIKLCPSECTHILVSNDDILFTGISDIDKIVKTINTKRWACAGPWILHNPHTCDPTRPKSKSSTDQSRRNHPVRTNSPVSGSCAIWRKEWLKRVGLYDLRFGEGYGMDEADMCYRVVRRGGRYGRDDRASIWHEMHGTFTDSRTRYAGSPHQRNLRTFKQKHGEGVEQWGRSKHWYPLPGLHVILSTGLTPSETCAKIRRAQTITEGLRSIITVCTESETVSTNVQTFLRSSDVDKTRIVRVEKYRQGYIERRCYRKVLNGKHSLEEKYPAIYHLSSNSSCSAKEIAATLHDMRNEGGCSRRIGKRKGESICHVDEFRRSSNAKILH